MLLPRLLRFNKSIFKSVLPLLRFNKSFFVDRQTTTTTTTSTFSSFKFGSFILQTYEPYVDSYGYDVKMFMLSSSGTGEEDEDDDDDQKKKKKKKMVFKLDEDLGGFSAFYKDFQLDDSLSMVGSCNGIICLHDPKAMVGYRSHHYTNLKDVYLWNPATRQFRNLPKSIPIKEKSKSQVAFGFDVKTKDYKVLRITPLRERFQWGKHMCRVQVYSLSTDSWRLLEDIVVPNQHSGLNGSCFFVGRKPPYSTTDGKMLLSFDFTNEIFNTMQLPDNCSINSYQKEEEEEDKKWDAAFTTPLIDSDGGYRYLDIWVSKNEQHGSGSSVAVYKESWTKIHSFRIKTKNQQPYSKPRCISNNGEFALISTGRNKLQLFNLVTKEVIKDFTIGDPDGDSRCRAAYAYKESLVSIMGGNVLLRWQLPTHGATYKLNLDAPFIASNFSFGIGLCLTSDTGGCIGVRSFGRMGYVSDAEEGKALAMLEAIKWVKKLELSPIIIESNYKNVVSFFMDDDDSIYWSSKALSLLREAKLLLNSSEIGISFQYCSKSCNYVADIAAKLGREELSWSSKDGRWKDWTANFPGEVVMSLSNDLGLVTCKDSTAGNC